MLPQVKQFMKLLPEVGELESVRSSFSFVLENMADARLDPKLDGGALMDLGCYCVSGSRLIAGTDPVVVYGEQKLAPSGVDATFSGLLRFPAGLVSQFTAGFGSEHRLLEAIGSKNSLLMRDPWHGEGGGIRLGGRAWIGSFYPATRRSPWRRCTRRGPRHGLSRHSID
jgi:xylose dehydrogenase (NAD/NADP)